MIVLDASALVEFLLRGPSADALDRRILAADESLHAPDLIRIEFLHVVRKQALKGVITETRAAAALARLAQTRLITYPHEPLINRIWQLRRNVSAYDAAYVALAEALDAPLMTLDRRLASAPGHRARIEAVDSD